MKKILILIIMIFTFNVYVGAVSAKDMVYTYEVEIDGKKYTANVKYWDLYAAGAVKNADSEDRYEIEYDSLTLVGPDGTEYATVDAGGNNRISNIGFKFTQKYSNSYVSKEDKSTFSKEEMKDPDFMKNYLPKFVKVDSSWDDFGMTTFITYIANEENVADEDKKEFIDNIKEYGNIEGDVASSSLKTINGTEIGSIVKDEEIKNEEIKNEEINDDDSSCEDGIATICGLPAGLVYMIHDVYNLLKIAVPIVLIIMGMIDMLKAVTGQKEDEIKKGWNSLIKRTIYGVIVYFVFFFVQLIVSLLPNSSGKSEILNCTKAFFLGEGAEIECIREGANTNE